MPQSKEDKTAYMKEWRRKNPDKVLAACILYKERHGERARKLNVQRSLKSLRIKQEKLAGRPKPCSCELCGACNVTICWDHNHVTGKFRGWICSGCNAALGFVKDSQERLLKLVEYLHNDGISQPSMVEVNSLISLMENV